VSIPTLRPAVGPAEAEAVRRVLESRWLGMGHLTQELELGLAEVVGTRHVVAVSSGTAALHAALVTLGVGPGDEVIVPSLTFVGCAQAVAAAGATPVLCEVGPDTVTIDVEDAARRVTPRTRAILAVDYAGFVSDMDAVSELARAHDVIALHDGAHALGSTYKGRPVGALGDATCFSFDPVKNVTCGEGGAVATDDDELAARLRTFRNLGIPDEAWGRRAAGRWEYGASEPGFRYMLPDLNAAIGLVQLDRFDELRERKRALLRRYRAALGDVDGLELLPGDIDSSFPFLCVARVGEGRRDELIDSLRRDGIAPSVHFVPIHLQAAFAGASLPTTERLYGELVSLPFFHEVSDAELDRVVASVRGFFAAS
jgi:perosamine synthetase